MRRLLPDPPSSPVGTLQRSQRSPHAVPEDSKDEPGLLYSISPALELQQQTPGSRSLSRAASSRSRAGSISRPTTLPPRPPLPGALGAVPKKKTAEEAPPVKATAPAQPSIAAPGVPPPPAPPVPENVMSFPVHSLTRRSAPSRGVAASRPPIAPRPAALFETYKDALLAGMAAGAADGPKLSAPPSEPTRGVVGRLPAAGGGQLVDVLANRRRVMAMSDGDETDH